MQAYFWRASTVEREQYSMADLDESFILSLSIATYRRESVECFLPAFCTQLHCTLTLPLALQKLFTY